MHLFTVKPFAMVIIRICYEKLFLNAVNFSAIWNLFPVLIKNYTTQHSSSLMVKNYASVLVIVVERCLKGRSHLFHYFLFDTSFCCGSIFDAAPLNRLLFHWNIFWMLIHMSVNFFFGYSFSFTLDLATIFYLIYV